MGFGDKMQIGRYTLVCDSYTQDDKPNYSSEWAVMDVYKNGKKIDTMYPERRFYKASEQTSTIVANRSRLSEDLYLVYTGRNQDTGKPIIKAHVNPLVMWIWIGRGHRGDRHADRAGAQHEAGEGHGEGERAQPRRKRREAGSCRRGWRLKGSGYDGMDPWMVNSGHSE